MPKKIDLTGQRFGKLFVKQKDKPKNNRAQYLCICDCGKNKVIPSAYLLHGNVKSCGCLRAELIAKIGRNKANPLSDSHHKLYKRWSSMKQRCLNPNNPHYKNYGARGITVCKEWADSFKSFVNDMGLPQNDNFTIERINNDLGYFKENCKWATRSEQLVNQRRSIVITYKNKTYPAKQWANILNISYSKITKSYRSGGIDAATKFIAQHY